MGMAHSHGPFVMFPEIPLPFTILGLLFAAFILASFLAIIWRGNVSRMCWSRTEGRVKTFGVNNSIPCIVFEYHVGDKTFESNKLIPSSTPWQYGKWIPREAVLNSVYLRPDGTLKFPPNATVDVYYNPKNPKDSALVPGVHIGVGGFLMIAGALAFSLWFAGALRGFEYWPFVFPAIFFFGGLVVLRMGLGNFNRYSRSRDFPSVQGRLLKADIAYMKMDKGGGYVPRVEFGYEVDGADYRSRQLNALSIQVAQSQNKAQLVIDGLRSNPTPQVYYDPKAPWDAFLRHGPKAGFLAPFLMGFVFVFAAVAAAVFLPHSNVWSFSGSKHPDYLPSGMYLPKALPGQTNVVRYVVREYADGQVKVFDVLTNKEVINPDPDWVERHGSHRPNQSDQISYVFSAAGPPVKTGTAKK